MSRVRISKSE